MANIQHKPTLQGQIGKTVTKCG